jgi:DNA-binding transcriptional ArsR family regulator
MQLDAPTRVHQNESMPRLAQPAGSEDARDPIALLGNLVKAGLLRHLRSNPDVTIGSICDALELPQSTLQPRLSELEAAGLVISDPPLGSAETRRGVWVRYRVNDEAVTDLYLRLGIAIGEF